MKNKKQNIKPKKKKLKNIIITTINNPREEKTGKKLTRSANDKREWVICTDLELAQSFDTMLTENEFWIIKWKWKWSNKYRANKMWSIDQWDETTINEKKKLTAAITTMNLKAVLLAYEMVKWNRIC